MLKKGLIPLILFLHLFILISSGIETHICIHESGYISFESVYSNGNCMQSTAIFNYKPDTNQHFSKYHKDKCSDILVNKEFIDNEPNQNLSNEFLIDNGIKIVYNIEKAEQLEYTSSNTFKNIQKIPLENRYKNIRTFIFLN